MKTNEMMKTKTHLKPFIHLGLAVSALFWSACSDDPVAETEPSNNESGQLDAFSLEEAPEGALSIAEARTEKAAGDSVVLTGKVMGRMEPFVNGRAAVMIGDPDVITSCDLMPGDACKTPWDVCCEGADTVATAVATIQLTDEDGRVLPTGLKGFQEMKELSVVTVTGKVRDSGEGSGFVVNADGLYVHP